MSWNAAARFILLAVLVSFIASPAAADWLVTRAGQRLETRGVWKVKGKLVVFHTAKGELSSLRLAEVDLEASRRATAEAEQARQAAAEEAGRRQPEKRPPVLVVTDDKVRHVEPGSSAAAAAAEPSPRLAVSDWERSAAPGDGHAVIIGTLRNASDQEATEITMAVQLLDEAGQTIATGQAVLTSTALGPGERSGFRVEFPGSSSFTEVRFAPRAAPQAKPGPQPAPPGDG